MLLVANGTADTFLTSQSFTTTPTNFVYNFTAAQLNALAYTQGSDIHVGPGQQKHVAHEAWHVVQQAQGRVSPTMQMNGTAINDSSSLEHEADVLSAP